MTNFEILENSLLSFYEKQYDKDTTEFVIYFTQKENKGIWYYEETILAKLVKTNCGMIPLFDKKFSADKINRITPIFNKKISDDKIEVDTIKIVPLQTVINYYGENVLGL